MKCPECQGPVRFYKSDIACSRCGWRPPTSVIDMYSMAGITDRRLLLGAAFASLTALGSFLVWGQLFAVVIIVSVALVTVPIGLLLRDRWIAKMLEDLQ